MQQPKYIYLLSSSSYGENGFFKVGVTCNYKNRLSQINNNTPFPISLVLVTEHKTPLLIEHMVLEKFKSYRLKGEWFYVKSSHKIDSSTCSYKEYMSDFVEQTKVLEHKIKSYLLSLSKEVFNNALL